MFFSRLSSTKPPISMCGRNEIMSNELVAINKYTAISLFIICPPLFEISYRFFYLPTDFIGRLYCFQGQRLILKFLLKTYKNSQFINYLSGNDFCWSKYFLNWTIFKLTIKKVFNCLDEKLRVCQDFCFLGFLPSTIFLVAGGNRRNKLVVGICSLWREI